MDHTHSSSPEASTNERAFHSSNTADATDDPLFPPSLVSPSLNDGFASTERMARRCRHDGWTPERVADFIQALAACGVVVDACRHVGLSAQSAYAYRNRREGRAFAKAWDAVLIHRSRGRLSDELLSRAMKGCVEAVHDQNGNIVGERHRYDNRLSMAVLTRLDRLAQATGEDDALLRAVSEDLDDYIDCVTAGGDTDAFVEARRPPPPPVPAPAPEAAQPKAPRSGETTIEDDFDLMASIVGCLGYKAPHPVDIDISDLEDVAVADWSYDQRLRARYSGYCFWKHLGEMGAQDGEPHDEENSPRAYMAALRAACDAQEQGEAAIAPDGDASQADTLVTDAKATDDRTPDAGLRQPSTSST